MRIAFRSAEEKGPILLQPADLPQAQSNVLDLSWPTLVSEGAIKVEIPRYSQLGLGDQVSVYFSRESEIVRRYCYLPNSESLRKQKYVAEVRVKPLTSLMSGNYEVEYTVTSRAGNRSGSAVTPVKIINSSYTSNSRGATVDKSFSGFYMHGVISNCVVPYDYVISLDKDIAIRSLNEFALAGGTSAGIELTISQSPPEGESKEIAHLQCADGEHWTVTPVSDSEIYLNRNDLISIVLEGNANARLFFALTM